jgi:hypothetical protein
MQYLCLREQLQDITLDKNTPDKFEWCWCPSGHYSLRSAYLDMFHGQSAVLGAKELWKAPIEFQLFKWLTKLDLTCIYFQKKITHCCFKFSSSIYSNWINCVIFFIFRFSKIRLISFPSPVLPLLHPTLPHRYVVSHFFLPMMSKWARYPRFICWQCFVTLPPLFQWLDLYPITIRSSFLCFANAP